MCFCKHVVAGMATTSLGKSSKGVIVCSSPYEDLLKISFQFGYLSFAFQLVTLVICCFWCIHLLSWLKVVCKTQSSVHLVSLDSWSIMQKTFLQSYLVEPVDFLHLWGCHLTPRIKSSNTLCPFHLKKLVLQLLITFVLMTDHKKDRLSTDQLQFWLLQLINISHISIWWENG